MCGIAGILSTDHSVVTNERLKKMTDPITHRGPESEAFWSNGEIGFGHRRLCIIDLSDAAAQPMHYLDRYTIIYNGEIYNYPEIRTSLQKQGYYFKSASDTEVLVAAYACYKEACLGYFDGMFAFAIWDKQEKLLFAGRDRFGEKPFYYTTNDKQNEFLFASEIKSLWAVGTPGEYDGTMLLNYLTLGWTEHPLDKEKTFYKNIYSLPPGHFLKQQLGNRPIITRYWQLDKSEKQIDTTSAVEQFGALFHTSVKRRLRSDVPIGTSLSGGLDSSSVIAAANRAAGDLYTHKSFSAVFPGFVKDESAYIKMVAQQYQLESHITSPVASDLADEFSRFMYYHEQPLSTASVFAQYKVYQLAKSHGVTVLLDGQGADETLAGYSKYINWYLQQLWRTNPSAFREEKNALKENNIPFTWNIRNLLAAMLPAVTAAQLESKALKRINNDAHVNPEFRAAYLDKQSLYKPVVRSLNDMLHFNSCYFGLGELLRYADANSMAHSREVRLPFLGHELVTFLFSLVPQMKIHNGWSKWLLRKTMEPHLPQAVVWRKEKVGFEPPEQLWLQDEKVQRLVTESKKRLVDLKILNPLSLHKKNQPPGEPATDNIDWRCMVAEALIK